MSDGSKLSLVAMIGLGISACLVIGLGLWISDTFTISIWLALPVAFFIMTLAIWGLSRASTPRRAKAARSKK
jgi:hypothetical protein